MPTDYNVDVSESVPLSDSLDGSSAANVGVSESVTAVESLNARAAKFPSLAETVALSEVLNGHLNIDKSVNESVPGAGDVLAVFAQGSLEVLEGVPTAEAGSARYDAIVNLNESLALSEALVARKRSFVPADETLGLGEALANRVDFHQGLFEQLAWTEALARQSTERPAMAFSVEPLVAIQEGIIGGVATAVYVNTRIRLTAKFSGFDTAAFDPQSILFAVLVPMAGGGTSRQNFYFTPGMASGIVRARPGFYFVDLMVTTPGVYLYGWQSLAPGEESLSEAQFTVLPRKVLT